MESGKLPLHLLALSKCRCPSGFLPFHVYFLEVMPATIILPIQGRKTTKSPPLDTAPSEGDFLLTSLL